MVCQSYGKAEPCLTSGGGAATNLPFVSRAASALVKYINAVSTATRIRSVLNHQAEAMV